METSCAEQSTPNAADRGSTLGKLALLGPVLPLLVLLVVWLSGGLHRFDTADEVAEALRALRGDRYALAYVMLGYGVGTVVFLPITGLIAGTLLAFGPVLGFVYALVGVQLAATTTYYAGRAFGGRALDHLQGPRIRKLRTLLRDHSLRASAAARVLPVGNFTLINWLIGGLKVPFRWFILGNALGALPGLVVMAVFADRLASALRDPQPAQFALLVGVGILALLLMYLAQRLAKRFTR